MFHRLDQVRDPRRQPFLQSSLENRCPLRSPWYPFFHALCLLVRIARALYSKRNAGGRQRKPGKRTRSCRYGSKTPSLNRCQALSTLSILQPFRRIVSGIPFLYQKVWIALHTAPSSADGSQITAASPIQALIATKSASTSFTVVHLDGRLDWMVAQRNALLAWTGHTLTIKPKLNKDLVRWAHRVVDRYRHLTAYRAWRIGEIPTSPVEA